MKSFFIHHPLFRLLSPLFSGVLVYLLLLLINNNINQLQETFLSQELYICIGLAYIIQEFSRLSLLFFRKLNKPKSFVLRLVLQIITSVIMTIFLVSITMVLYFKYVLLYTPNARELLVFNYIFIFITIIYVILYIAHYYLYKLNTDKISKEADAKAAIEDDFKEFKKGINPNLLFESLEALIVLLKDSPDKAENLTDNFSSIYRYILTQKNSELGSLEDEIIVLEELVSLFNYLPYRKIKLEYDFSETIAIVPCTLLQVVETIVKTTVVSEEKTIAVSIYEEENGLCISYSPEEKLRESLELSSLSEISKRYEFYSNQKIQLVEKDTIKSIILPKLNYKEAS